MKINQAPNRARPIDVDLDIIGSRHPTGLSGLIGFAGFCIYSYSIVPVGFGVTS